MGNMKESGIEWIGDIPKEWKVDKLKYHLKRNEPRNPGNQPILSLYREYGVIPKDSREDNHNVTSEDTSKYKYVQVGNFVINKMKAWQGSVAVSDFEGVISPAYYVYEFTDKEIDKKFFHYLMRSCYKGEFRRLSGGIREGQWDLPSEALNNTPIVFPKIEIQKRIATFLDVKCSEIDSLVMDIQTEIDTLEEYRTSIIDDVLMYGISGKSKHKKVRFKYIATVKSNLVSPIFYSEYPQVSPDNIAKNTGKLISYSTVKESGIVSGNHLFYKGQIIYSKIRPNLNKAIIAPFDGLFSADMYPIEAKIDSKYLLYAMLSRHFVGQVKIIMQDRVKMPKINQEELGNMRVYIAPDTEQKEIALYLDKKCAEIDSIIETKKEQLTVLDEYKKTIIFEYVTGKKEVI